MNQLKKPDFKKLGSDFSTKYVLFLELNKMFSLNFLI